MALDLSKLEKVKQRGDKIEAQCPACFEAGQDKKGNHLIIYADGTFGCAANSGDKEHRRRIAELAGLDDKDRVKSKPAPATPRPTAPAPKSPQVGKEVATYPYLDADGTEVYRVVRYEPKDFRPFKVIRGEIVAGLAGVERLPYRLPEVVKASTVWIVEGEKDADNLAMLGIVATCRAGGSSKWDPELTAWFNGKDVILCGDNDAPGQKYMDAVEAALKPVAKSIKRARVPDPHKDISDALEGLSDGEATEIINAILIDPMAAALAPRRFDITKPPKRTEPVLWINDVGIAKPGDLVVIQAQVKSGKSSLLAAMMGCLMGAGRMDCDFLGVRGSNPGALPVLHIDTEQTPEDHYDMIMRTLKRAGLSEPPAWFHSYCLTDFNVDRRRAAIKFETERLTKTYGGMCNIFLDGSADIVHDVNDAEESNDLVDELFAMAIRCACPVVSIIHENHSSDNGKTRGHLGSQLMRKAASNLRLAKDGASGVIQLWAENLRRGHIAKGTGPHFVWDDQRGMHVTCETTRQAEMKVKDKSRLAAWFDTAGDIFSGTTSSLRHADLIGMVMKRDACSESTANRRIQDMKKVGILKYSLYLYQLNHDFKL